MQRFSTIALLLLSLTFLGQARVEPFSCGATVAYSSASVSGCQMACCKSSSCCKSQRTKQASPIHYNGGLKVSLDSVEGSYSLSRPLLILPMPAGLVVFSDAAGNVPPVLTRNCVRLI
jgi:hypothetical protein